MVYKSEIPWRGSRAPGEVSTIVSLKEIKADKESCQPTRVVDVCLKLKEDTTRNKKVLPLNRQKSDERTWRLPSHSTETTTLYVARETTACHKNKGNALWYSRKAVPHLVKIKDLTVKMVPHSKYLGILLDSNLTFNGRADHIMQNSSPENVSSLGLRCFVLAVMF